MHAFSNDLLADHDAMTLAVLVRDGHVSPTELVAAVRQRARRVADLAPIAFETFDGSAPSTAGPFFGVATFVKDNLDVAGMPSGHGSEAFTAKPAKSDDPYVKQLRATGLALVGKSRLPEFGFNATAEYRTGLPVRNPWNPEYSAGGSSGGAAALVASGVVPIAHANDGGGSIRIPAACTGLVGLKPTRGRHVRTSMEAVFPVKVVSEGVLTRTVRDTAEFHAAMARVWSNPHLPPLGRVEGPGSRCLRIGVTVADADGVEVHPQIRDAVERVAKVLESHGHILEPVATVGDRQFTDDFTMYWGLLATMSAAGGPIAFGRDFDVRKIDGLTEGLRRHFARNIRKAPGAIRRLRKLARSRFRHITDCDVVLSPVVAHAVPPLGHLSPTTPFDVLRTRLLQFAAFTAPNNVDGTPAISLPVALSREGLPIGVQLAGQFGGEQTLLELAYLIEAECPRPRIEETRTHGRI
ncbi:amidase [Mycobacterium intermedium]